MARENYRTILSMLVLKSKTNSELFVWECLLQGNFYKREGKYRFFKDAADEADQKKWRGLMLEIESTGSAVLVLRQYKTDGDQGLPRDLVLGTLIRFKQLKKWNLVSEVISKDPFFDTRETPSRYVLKLPERPSSSWFTLWMKPTADEKSLIDEDGDFHDLPGDYSLVSVPPPSPSHPSNYYNFCTVVVGSEIYLIGAPYNAPPSSAVRILDCRNHTWRDGPSMMVARMNAIAVYLDEKIYVMRGCRGIEESWMEVFDVKTQTWKPLPCHGAAANEVKSEISLSINVLEGKIYAIAELKDYLYDPKESTWEFVETPSNSQWLPSWCVIENVMYCYTNSGFCMWCDTKSKEWREVKGLDLVPLELLGGVRSRVSMWYDRIWAVLGMLNYGGKLLVMWTPWYEDYIGNPDGRIFVGIISLEKSQDGCEIWGKKEWGNSVFKVPRRFYDYEFLSCAVISI